MYVRNYRALPTVGPELQPELRPELQPEPRPELHPELRPELQQEQPEVQPEEELTWREWFDMPLATAAEKQPKPLQQGTLPQQVQQQWRQ